MFSHFAFSSSFKLLSSEAQYRKIKTNQFYVATLCKTLGTLGKNLSKKTKPMCREMWIHNVTLSLLTEPNTENRVSNNLSPLAPPHIATSWQRFYYLLILLESLLNLEFTLHLEIVGKNFQLYDRVLFMPFSVVMYTCDVKENNSGWHFSIFLPFPASVL